MPIPDWVSLFVRRLGLPGIVERTFLRLLPPGQGIPPHVDPPLYTSPRIRQHRFHLPLVTHPDVVMRWPDEDVRVHLEKGWLYEVRFDRLHEVVNHAPINRIHLQIDTVAPVTEENTSCSS